MRRSYSRRRQIKQKRSTRSAVFYVILTIGAILLVFIYGLPMVAKFAAFLTDLHSSSTPVEVTDTTPPPPPRFDTLPSYTNEDGLNIEGTTEEGANVTISFNGQDEDVLANSEGRFSYTTSLRSGNNTLSAYATDSSGNKSVETEKYSIVYDNQPPDLEVNKPQDGAQFYGSKQRQITIEGTTEEDAKIIVNNRQVIVDSDGRFVFTTSLEEGENNFKITSEDQAGNKTETSINVNFSP
jgi:hypothetical protein